MADAKVSRRSGPLSASNVTKPNAKNCVSVEAYVQIFQASWVWAPPNKPYKIYSSASDKVMRKASENTAQMPA